LSLFRALGGGLLSLSFAVETKNDEHISAWFAPPGRKSPLTGLAPADVHNRDPRKLPLLSKGVTPVRNGVLGHAESVVFCQLVPWQLEPGKQMNRKRTFRRASCLLTRLAANMGAAGSTPLPARFSEPMKKSEQRWLMGLYLDVPEEWDDPYRFFRW
jgi:hypothetical protein